MDSLGFCKTSPGLPRSGSDSPAPLFSEFCGMRSGMPVAEDMVVSRFGEAVVVM